MRKSEYREMIVTLALVYAKRRINKTDRYEVDIDDIDDAIAERGNRSGYKFARKAIADDVRKELKDHYGRSTLPDLLWIGNASCQTGLTRKPNANLVQTVKDSVTMKMVPMKVANAAYAKVTA